MATAKRHRLTVGERRAQLVRLGLEILDVGRAAVRDLLAVALGAALRAAGNASQAGPR